MSAIKMFMVAIFCFTFVIGGVQIGNPLNNEPYWSLVAVYEIIASGLLMYTFIIPMYRQREQASAIILAIYAIAFTLLSARWLLTH